MWRLEFHLLFLIESFIDECCDDSELWEPFCKIRRTFGASNEVQEENMVFGNSFGFENVYSHQRRTTYVLLAGEASQDGDKQTCSKHRVEQQHPSICDILRELFIEQFRLGRLFVPLDQDLAYPDRPAAFT